MHATGRPCRALHSQQAAAAKQTICVRRTVGRRAVAVRADAAAGGDKVVCVGEALFGKYPAVLDRPAHMYCKQSAVLQTLLCGNAAAIVWLWAQIGGNAAACIGVEASA
jgi:hypothetical protein